MGPPSRGTLARPAPPRCYPPGVDESPEVPPETLVLKHDPNASAEERELKFELDFLAGLTTHARFELMFKRSREMAEALAAHGHRAPSQALKRP